MESLKKLVLMKYNIDLTNDIETLKLKLPFCKEEEGCKNLKYSGGLFTQCCKETNEDFCKVCKSEINRGGSKYGTIYDRKKYNLGEFISNNGKPEIDYLKYMKQHGYTKDMVINAAKLRELELPENIFGKKNKVLINKEVVTKRDVIVDDTESEKDSIEESESLVKRGRGRPRKDTKKIINQEDIEVKNDSKKQSSSNLTKQKNQDSKCKIQEEIKPTVQESQPSKPEKEVDSDQEIDLDKEINLNKEINLEDSDLDSDSDSEHEIEVRKFNFKGVTYLKDINNNKIYTDDGEHLGFYNNKTDNIEFV